MKWPNFTFLQLSCSNETKISLYIQPKEHLITPHYVTTKLNFIATSKTSERVRNGRKSVITDHHLASVKTTVNETATVSIHRQAQQANLTKFANPRKPKTIVGLFTSKLRCFSRILRLRTLPTRPLSCSGIALWRSGYLSWVPTSVGPLIVGYSTPIVFLVFVTSK